MDLDDTFLKGQAVMQHCVTELEKIAYSKRVQKLYAAARNADGQVGEAAKALGVRRFVPFTAEHRAYYGHAFTPGSGVKSRARQAANTAERAAGAERKSLVNAVERGAGNQSDVLRRLREGPSKVGPVTGRARQLARAAGAHVPVEEGKKAPQPTMVARRAAIGLGLAGAGAAAGYAALKPASPYEGY